MTRYHKQYSNMNTIKDIHTHHTAPQAEALICTTPETFDPVENQLYSVGIHPWTTAGEVTDDTWEKLEAALSRPCVKALGECGIDIPKGGPLFRQMLVFKRQIELSEKIEKPMIIHCVKAQDIIIGIKKDMKPVQPWLVHGFRGKPTIAKMLTDAGIALSFGEYFNETTLKNLDKEFMFAETDESTLSIEEIISRLSEVRGEEVTSTIVANTARFLKLQNLA